MATQIESPAASGNPAGSNIDRYVGQQLKRTSQQARLSDIVTGILVVVSFVLSFFILAAIVDAWFWTMTPVARAIALTLFASGIGAIFWYTLWPLLVRKINPQYAAKMIEEAKPGFKNSLLNYLELKRDKTPVHRAILTEVSKRAATDLSRVSIDSAVDKSNLIRIGFVLIGLVALSIAYLIFSPKSPFPTVMRVLAPGARISRPAAVMIQDVNPEDTTVFFGDRLDIAAKISGTHNAEEVRIVYSAQDAQIVEAVVPMQYSGASGLYTAVLETGPAGIQQPLHYYIAAGDGVSPTYKIDVRPNPSISINSIVITPPKYTNLPARTIEGYGEVKAVEGSKIEIKTTANLPIEVAYIVPLIANDDAAENGEYRELRAIPMKLDGSQAIGNFVAALNASRNRPLYTHYKIQFRSTNDFQNEQANIYAIRVIADLAPEVEIVEPVQKELAIPVNQPFPVEVWASDLDYEISSVDLHLDHQANRILDRKLQFLVDGQNAGGRVTARLQLTPAQLGLEPGDKAIFFATASDNRISPSSDLPDPNISRTENYTLIVTDEIENPKQPKTPQKDQESNQENGSEQNQQNPGETGSSQESQNESDQQSGDSKEGASKGGNESAQKEPSDSQSTDSGEDSESDGGETDEAVENSQGSSQPGKSGNESGADSEPNSNPSEGDEVGDQQGAASETDENEPGHKQNAGSQSQNQSNPAGEQQGGTESGQDEGDLGQNADGSTESSQGQESGGADGQGNPTRENGENSSGQAGGSEFREEQLQNGDSQPLDKNAPDGERFERLKKYFEEQQEKQQDDAGGRASDQSDHQVSPELQNSSEQTKTADDSGDDPSNKDDSRDSNASQSDQPASQRSENSDPQPGNQQPKNNSSDQARDREPDQPVPNGSESESGNPDESEQGAGTRSENDQEGTTPGDSNSESSEGSESRSESSEQKQETEPTSGKPDAGQDGNQQSESSDGSNKKGNKPGGESSSKDSTKSSESGGEPSTADEPSSNGEPSSKPSSSQSTEPANAPGGQESESNSKSTQPNSDAQPGGVGGGVESQPNGKPPVEDDPNPEKANLDYAKKVTDLILDNLEDQQYEPDQELLDQMNWTQQDLDRFLKSWQLMKNNAKTGDIKAQQEYGEALRSLGLERKPKGRTVDIKKDDPFQLNEDGAVDQIPAEYVDPFNSFLKRRNRSKR